MMIRNIYVSAAVAVSLAGWLVLAAGCGQPDQEGENELWADDNGRKVEVKKGSEWVGTWVATHTCPNEGSPRPPERFRLKVDEHGKGVGTIGICRYGFKDCRNGPVVVRYEARVTANRIEGTVMDRDCHNYIGTEVFSRISEKPAA